MGLSRRWLFLLVALLAPAAVAQPLAPSAKPPAAPAAAALPASPEPASRLDRADLEAWLDGFMPYALERGDIAGAVVTVVKDGKPILAKGYGYADVAKKTPVSPDDTLFRPGSVSKLFTWTAVMQLVGAGKLDLDRDVNAYLDFKIPERPDGPVTLRRLMTHTAGFEETVQGLISADPQRIEPLEATLKHWVPERIYPAGSTPAYSNYGAALAGYIVQRVSGEPFEAYVERHIFQPIGMVHSSMRQPLPAALQPLMSKGYATASGPAQPYEFINMSPAGALATSGSDMGRFMIAHLADEGGAGKLLPAGMARMMHRTIAPGIGPLNKMALGFYESNLNGRHVISHGGDTQWFHSDLNLFIDDGVGIFINVNSPGRDGAAHQLRAALLRAFADRYFPGPQPYGQVPAQAAKADAKMMAGIYLNSRGSHSNFASIVDLLGQTKIAALPDGTLVVSGLTGLNGQPLKWREIAPFVWRDVASQRRLAAVVKDGKVVRFSSDDLSPFMVFDRVAWPTSSAWLLPALLAGLGALALTVLLWPVAILARRRYAAPFALTGAEAWSYRAARLGALGTLLVAGGWSAVIVLGLNQLDLFGPPLAPWIALLGLLGPLVVLAALAATAWDVWEIWRRRRSWRSWFARLWSVVLVLGVAVTLWVVLAFHMYGLNSHY